MPLDAQIGQLLQSLPPSRTHGTRFRFTFHTQSSDPSAAAAAAAAVAAPDGVSLLMARAEYSVAAWRGAIQQCAACVGWQRRSCWPRLLNGGDLQPSGEAVH